jgi:benzoate membrane transport protein
MFKSFSNITAGFIAVMVGYTSSVVIILEAAQVAGATPAQISSWLLALGIGMAVTCIGLSLYYRVPILTAWSTPGAALLATSLSGVPMAEAIAAFIFSSILIMLAGFTGFFEKMMKHIPQSLASAMLAGILLQFGTNIFVAMQQQFYLVCAMFVTYLVVKRVFPRMAVLLVLLVGMLVAAALGLFKLGEVQVALSWPVFTAPEFSMATMIGVGIPLFIVTMCSQNIPGVVAIHTAEYRPPISPIIGWTGVTNFVLAPFGGFAFNLAAITAAICLSEEADQDPAKRYKASIYAGLFYLVAGIFGATVVALFYAMPKQLVLAIAGLALLGTIGNSLKLALDDNTQREPALITLLVSASGISLFGIGAAFWGLVAGVLSLFLLRLYKRE